MSVVTKCRFWDVTALREIERLDLPGPVQTVAPAGDDYLAVLCREGTP